MSRGSRRPSGPQRGGRTGDNRRGPAPSARPSAPPPARAPGAEAEGRVLFGVNPVREALRRRADELGRLLLVDPNSHAELVTLARDAGVPVERATRDRLDDLTRGAVHQGVAAMAQQFSYAELEDLLDAARESGRPALIVVLDGIQDPHNLGAIIRSAHALGANGVVIAKDRAAQITGAVAKTSAGAVEHCPVARVTNLSRALEQLKEAGLWVLAADPDGKDLLPKVDLRGPMALVIGSEGPGIREGVLKHSDYRVRIPMLGQVASLNASVSASLLLYEALRQRTGA